MAQQIEINNIDAKVKEILPSENGYKLFIQVNVERILINEKKETTVGYYRQMQDIGSQNDTVKENPILKRIIAILNAEAISPSIAIALQGSIRRNDKSAIITNILNAFQKSYAETSLKGFFSKKLVCTSRIPLKSIRGISQYLGTSIRDIWLIITITVKKQ